MFSILFHIKVILNVILLFIHFRDNRQFRMEERHENGTVTGHYGYYDARGKLRKIFYSSKPSLGYTEDPPISTSDSR